MTGERDLLPAPPRVSASPPAILDARADREALNEGDRHGRHDLDGRSESAALGPASRSFGRVDLADPDPVARRRGFFGQRDPWRRRPDGDRKIQAQLVRLSRRDARWRVVHGIPVGVNGSPIDHLVIGPGGVYALSAKFHPNGRVWVRGNVFRVDDAAYAHVSNSRHEALRASRSLGAACGFAVSVTGVVVVVGAEHIAVSEAPGDVHVVNRSALRGWLGRRDDILDAPAIEAVHGAASRPATWVPPV